MVGVVAEGDYIIEGEHLIYPDAVEKLRGMGEKAYRTEDKDLAIRTIRYYRKYNLYIPDQLYQKVRRKFRFTTEEMR